LLQYLGQTVGLVGEWVEDLYGPIGKGVASPGDLLAVGPLDLDHGGVGPGDAPLDAVVGAAHVATHLQRLGTLGLGEGGLLFAVG
jgi:hypothetical protein